MKALRFAVLFLAWSGATGFVQAADEPCQVDVVLFVPAGVDPPPGYRTRVDEVVAYTEAFFAREFKRWGHKDLTMPFRRTADGHVEVAVVRGTRQASDCTPVSVRDEVVEELRKAEPPGGGLPVRWIMVYLGDPPKVFAPFKGGFGEKIGGWAVNNFSTLPGRIDPRLPMGAALPVAISLKGIIHELGHAFRLPHVGPIQRDNAGLTLMGPRHADFLKATGRHAEHVYLSAAEAAMFAVHPAFHGKADEPGDLPTPEAAGLTARSTAAAVASLSGGRSARRPRPGSRSSRTRPTHRPGNTGPRPTPAKWPRTGRSRCSCPNRGGRTANS